MSIVGRNYLFGFDGGLMDSAISEVGDLIRIKEELAGTAGMTSIRRRAYIPSVHSVCQPSCVDTANEPSSAFHEEFSVPGAR